MTQNAFDQNHPTSSFTVCEDISNLRNALMTADRIYQHCHNPVASNLISDRGLLALGWIELTQEPHVERHHRGLRGYSLARKP